MFRRQQLPDWPPLVWVVLAGTFLTRAAFFMVWPFLAVLLDRQFGLSPSLIGSILAAMALGSAMVGFYSGNLSDRFGRRTLMVTGSLAAGAAYVVMAFAQTVTAFAVGAFLVGFTRASLEAPGKALIADRVTEPAPRELAYHARYFLINAGAAVGPLLGFALGLAARQATFLVTGAVYGLFTIAIVAAFHRSPESRRTTERGETSLVRVVAVLRKDHAFLVLMLAMFLMLVSYSQQESTLVQYLNLEGGDRAVALVTALIMTNAVTIVVFQFPFLALMRGLRLATRNYIGMTLVGAGFLVYTVLPVPNIGAWIAGTWIVSMGESILFPTLNLEVDRMAPEHLKGSYFGAAALSGLGFSAGPLAGGLLLETFGGPFTFGAMAAVMGTCAICYRSSTTVGARRNRARQTSNNGQRRASDLDR